MGHDHATLDTHSVRSSLTNDRAHSPVRDATNQRRRKFGATGPAPLALAASLLILAPLSAQAMTLSIEPTSVTVDESANEVAFDVVLTADPGDFPYGGTVSCNGGGGLSLQGTATEGVDYSANDTAFNFVGATFSASGQRVVDAMTFRLDPTLDFNSGEPDEVAELYFGEFGVNCVESVFGQTIFVDVSQGYDAPEAELTITDIPVPSINLIATDGTANESGDTGTVTFTTSSPNWPGGVTVNYSIAPWSTAQLGIDYNAAPVTGTVFIPQGQAAVNVPIEPIQDTIVEGVEYVALQLEEGSYSFGNQTTAYVDIYDDDFHTLSITATDVDASENNNPGAFLVDIGPAAGPLGVLVQLQFAGSATEGSDYPFQPSELFIAPGQSQATLRITPIDDDIIEPSESLFASVVGATTGDTGACEGPCDIPYELSSPSSASITIADNDTPVVAIAASDANAAEQGLDPGRFTISVDRPAPAGGLNITYSVRGSASAGADYTALSGSAVIAEGGTNATVTVTPVDDAVLEGPETVEVALTAQPSYKLSPVAPTQATVTIADNEVLPIATIGASDGVAHEEGLGTGEFTVTLNQAAPAGGLSVRYQVGGTATPRTDYVSLSGSVTIPADATSATILVQPRDDVVVEPDESITATLVAGDLYEVGEPASASVTLIDDDLVLPAVNFRVADANASETGDRGAIRVDLTLPAPAGGLIVNYNIGGTATNGADYESLPGSITVPGGEDSALITIVPLDDAEYEDSETVELSVAVGNNYTLGASLSATVVIADDEEPPAPEQDTTRLVIEPQDPSTARIGETVEVQVRVLGDQGQPLEGALIEWGLNAAGQEAGGTVTPIDDFTDADGVARASLATSAPEVYIVRVKALATAPGGELIEANADVVVAVGLVDVVDLNTPEGGMAVAIDTLCPAMAAIEDQLDPTQRQLLDRCVELLQASESGDQDDQVANALRAMSPDEAAAYGTLDNTIATRQLLNVGSRLAALRRGIRGVSLSGLSFNVDGQTVPGSVFQQMLAGEQGGAAAADDAGGLMSSRWGLFLTGTLSTGDKDETSNESGYTFDTQGITLGVDYRFSDQFVGGGAIGYANTELDLSSNGGNMDAKGQTFSLYGMYYPSDNTYISALVGIGGNSFDTVRNVDYVLGTSTIRRTALGSTDSSTVSGSLGGGYQWVTQNGLTTELFGRFDYVSTDIDGYTETGAQELALNLQDQSAESQVFALGAQLFKAFSFNWGVLQPQLGLSWEHEAADAYLIRGSFVHDPFGTAFQFSTDEPDRDYWRGTAGLTAVWPGGFQGFVQYDAIRQSSFATDALQFGLRYETSF